MAIVNIHTGIRRLLPFVALMALVQVRLAEGQIKLSPGTVPIWDNELNSPINEPQVTINENSSNAVMRPVPPEIQNSKDPLVKLVYETREAQRRRLLSTAEHTPWQIMHGMLALREEFLIRHNGKPVNCLEWIQSGPTFEGEGWFEKTQVQVYTGRRGNQAYESMIVGRGHPYNKPYAFEGHINQFVAIMSMSGVPLETQFQTQQGPVSMRDMLTYAKLTVNEKEEVTWTLWALSRYLPPDAEWLNARGEKWSIERLVQIETGKSLQGAPCGGTHGLFALAHARNVYLRSGKPLQGVWLQAEQKIRRYIQTARMQQNSNGSLSSNYFRGREYKQDFDKRMASSGHVLEFLMMALPSRELNDPWVRRAIEATSNDLMANRKSFVSCSPLYHSTSALSIYLDRVAKPAANVAQGAPNTHTISNSKEIKSADASLTHPESVKLPVMESSGVDVNGAPKAITGPAPKELDLPATTTTDVVPTAEEPKPADSVPVKTESPSETEEPMTTGAAPSASAPSASTPTPTTKHPGAESTPETPPTPEPPLPTPKESNPSQEPRGSSDPAPLTIPMMKESFAVQSSEEPASIVPENPLGYASLAPQSTKVLPTTGPIPKDDALSTESPLKPVPVDVIAAQASPSAVSNSISVIPMVTVSDTKILSSQEQNENKSVPGSPLPAKQKTFTWRATAVERRRQIVIE